MSSQSICRRVLRFAVAFALAAASAGAAVLCPEPLHIVRRIEDPIAQTVVTIDEYCSASRIVSVSRDGSYTVIEDFASGELVEIDRVSGTFSTSGIDALASSRAAQSEAGQSAPQLRGMTGRMSAYGRGLEVFESADENTAIKRRIEVAIDRHVALTRSALEALIGAAHPQAHGAIHDVILAAAAGSRAVAAASGANDRVYGLPAEVIVASTADGETLIERNLVLSVDRRSVPPDALLVPPGSTRVESRLLRFAKEADALDHPKGHR